ncbi:ACT domain-containing protein [Corallincola holothuriorum]|uniref:Glycine cleavage system transcriptional repressor n=1 Tax=Corallincola holothuriorum TaxID=2282215 RepID=A0A368NS03_9GAMM|nr:ACT domain-containing protein [Corallincola holothuriorum]RCU52444.1 ACT domain-containing protein [Corallincola holothuriorum]
MTVVTLVSFVGSSRPGLLKDLAEQCHQLGARWLNSKVSYLGGQIAALIRVEMPEEKAVQLESVFRGCGCINVRFSEIQQEKRQQRSQLKLSVDAEDRPGIVNELTQLFDRQGVEVVDLESHRMGVAELGGNVFTAGITLNLPPEITQEQLVTEIESIAGGLVVRDAVPA